MTRLYQLLILISLSGLNSGCGPVTPAIPKAEITLQLVDDDGLAVPEAKVSVVGFHVSKEGKTDKAGLFAVTLRNASAEVEFTVDKEGFHSINRHTFVFTGNANGKWLPLNALIRLQLHKVGQPVPMVVKQVGEELPVLGRPVGYDLLKSDWVKPYGHGENSDFIFEAKRWSHGIDNVNGWLRLTVSNPGEGLVPVRLFWRDDHSLRLAARAPSDGYKPKWWWQVGEGETPPGEGWLPETNMDQDANYYLRVRTHPGTNGEPEGGMYGKIYRGISLGLWTYRTNVTVNFEYYLNPDGTRNTEFDTRSNLCPNPGTGGGRP
jgi:hypothetical protein